MSKRLISLLLVLILSASLIAIGSISSSAAGATIKVGGTNYPVNIGDYVTYKLSFNYSANKIATAQMELPTVFSVLEGPSQDDLDSIFGENDDFSIFRYDTPNTHNVVGYVGSYVSFTGMDCSASVDVLTLHFKVIKAGTVTLAAGLRDVSDVKGNDIIDNDGVKIDNTFSYTETLSVVPSTVKISGTVTSSSYLFTTDTVTVKLSGNNSEEVIETKTGTGASLPYSFDVSPFSTYNLTVSKNGHVERKYTVNVTDAGVTQNMKICPLGDVNNNGKVDIRDVNTLYNHVKGSTPITDEYKLWCGDVRTPINGNPNIRDVNTLYNTVKSS